MSMSTTLAKAPRLPRRAHQAGNGSLPWSPARLKDLNIAENPFVDLHDSSCTFLVKGW